MEHPAHIGLREYLLDGWQRNFPLVPQPFGVMAHHLGTSEKTVIGVLESLHAEGAISRVGGVVRPNTLGASTLAAIAAPDLDAGAIAALLSAEPGINHVYLRENDWNLWFVVTGPDRTYVNQVVQRVQQKTGCHVLDLRLERPYHIDLGFKLSGDGTGKRAQDRTRTTGHSAYNAHPIDRALLQVLTRGLPLVPQPFAQIGKQLNCSEDEIIGRLHVLIESGIVPRIGVIVRHRALGWRSNAMVVWDVPENDIDRAGEILASSPGINLCYRRTRHASEWPYNLYCMVHARSRDEALDHLLHAQAAAALESFPRQILFSLRCYKQTGAMLAAPKEAA
jgi:DNA-binding Lrp family transcriptional regulator